MDRKYHAYSDGNAARQLSGNTVRREHRDKRQSEKRHEALDYSTIQAIKRRKRINLFSSFIIIAAIAASMFFCIDYISSSYQVLSLKKEVVKLQRETAAIEIEIKDDKKEIDASIDLKEVYNKAVNEFGMVPALDSQIFTYKNKRSDRVVQYADIPE